MEMAGDSGGIPEPHTGETDHALWHFSEDADLHRFEPRLTPSSATDEELVWAIDTRHAPLFWFPRDCPRACAWLTRTTTAEDRIRFLGHSAATRLHVIESAWLERMQACRLYAYRLPEETFEVVPEGPGYWISRAPVEAIEQVEVGDLLTRHARAGIELRVTPNLWPFWHSVIFSTLNFSGSRLRNTATPEPPLPPRP